MRFLANRRLILILFGLIWLKLTVSPALSIRSVRPDLFFIFLVFYAFRIHWKPIVPLAFFTHNLTLFAFGLGFLADELPLIPVKGLGYRNEHWRGCDDYFTAWCVAGVFVITCVVYLLRDYLAALI